MGAFRITLAKLLHPSPILSTHNQLTDPFLSDDGLGTRLPPSTICPSANIDINARQSADHRELTYPPDATFLRTCHGCELRPVTTTNSLEAMDAGA